MKTVIHLIATALGVALAAWVLPGIVVHGSDLAAKIVTLLVVAILIALVNLIVRPVVRFLTGCLVVVTMGLFLLVINALMLMLVGWLSGQFNVGFEVQGFWSALFGSVVISIVSGAIVSLLWRGDDRRSTLA